jgi:hypothetical protein
VLSGAVKSALHRSPRCRFPRSSNGSTSTLRALTSESEEHWVAVHRGPEGRDVRRFGAFTGDLCALAGWLKRCEIETVAMESTGVYWIALYELLVERGFEVLLVDARRLQNVPGRKTDVLDCQWLQELHTYGFLRGAFRPADQVCVLRSYLRQRWMLVAYASHHIQHMQKALDRADEPKACPCGQRHHRDNRHGIKRPSLARSAIPSSWPNCATRAARALRPR